MSNEPMTAKEVRGIRSDLKMTQTELAEALGVAKNTVARYESDGEHHVKPSETVAKLLRMLHGARAKSLAKTAKMRKR